MLKKLRLLTRPTLARRDAPCPRQGRSESRPEEVQTALRVGRSPLEWILANGKTPTVLPTSEKLLLNVEGLNDARTKLADFFSILLTRNIHSRVAKHRRNHWRAHVPAGGILVPVRPLNRRAARHSGESLSG